MTISKELVLSFFSKDFKFWIYHFTMLFILVFLQLALSFFMRGGDELLVFSLFAMGSWAIGFTITVFYYRVKYRQKQWQEISIVKLIFFSIVLAIIYANIIFFFFLLISIVYFWTEIYAIEVQHSPSLSQSELFFKVYVGNITSTSLFLFTWMFLYIGITNARSAKLSQLDNLRLQNSLKGAQLSSLSNQLNPHFLFNSLNNIRFMIHENAELADNMITSLSEVLRYSLESSEHEKCLLSKEVEVIQRYIEIINIQFEERLDFNMEIPDTLMTITVPPMVLQMLIENAVKHGLEQMQHGGRISLVASSQPQYIEFKVVNDIPEKGSIESNSTGLGLKNIQQRLALLYSDKASIEAKKVDNTFEVTICLPH